MTDKDFLTHDFMQINKSWKHYWKERVTWVNSKTEKRKLQQEKEIQQLDLKEKYEKKLKEKQNEINGLKALIKEAKDVIKAIEKAPIVTVEKRYVVANGGWFAGTSNDTAYKQVNIASNQDICAFSKEAAGLRVYATDAFKQNFNEVKGILDN